MIWIYQLFLIFNLAQTAQAQATSQATTAEPLLLKKGPEIFFSYSTITGVSTQDTEIRALYNSNLERLPKLGQPQELSNAVVLGLTELGGAFCKKAIDREKVQMPGQRLLFGIVNFNRGPSQFTTLVRERLFDHLAVLFWTRNITEAEVTSISSTFSKSIKVGVDTAEETLKSLQILCATYGTSLAFLVK